MRFLLISALVSTTLFAQQKLDCPSKKHYLQKGFHAGTTKIASLHCVLDGDFDGPTKSWHPNGKIRVSGQYKDGNMTGQWTRWHDNSKVHDKGTWKNSRPIGDWEIWYKNGKPHKKGQFARGEKIGVWQVWDSKGKKKEVNFGKSKNDFFITLKPISEILTYNVDWSDAKAKYATALAFDNDFIWKHHFGEKWKSVVVIGQRHREFDYEGSYSFDTQGDHGVKLGFGVEYKTIKRTWGVMLQVYDDYYVQHGTEFNPQNTQLKQYSFENAALKLYTDQYLYRGDRWDWKINASLILVTNPSEDGDEDIDDDIHALPQGGFGAELGIQADYKISSRKTLYFAAEAHYQKQDILRSDTGMEFSTDRVSLGLLTGYKFNMGRMDEAKVPDMKNWVSISLVPLSQVLTYSIVDGGSAQYGTEESFDMVFSWKRRFSKKWSGELNFTASKRLFDDGGLQYLYHNDEENAITSTFGLVGKRFGFHLGVKNQIILRHTPSDGKIDVDTALNPIAVLTYEKDLFNFWKMDFGMHAQLTALFPNFMDSEDWNDEDHDGFNDNVIDAGFGGEAKLSLIGTYKIGIRSRIRSITFFQYGMQSVSMKDTYVDFNVSKMSVGLGAQYSYLF